MSDTWELRDKCDHGLHDQHAIGYSKEKRAAIWCLGGRKVVLRHWPDLTPPPIDPDTETIVAHWVEVEEAT